MAYPTTLDSFTANVDNVDVIYASDVNELQTAITSLETKIGIDGSAVTTTHDYKLSGVTGSDKAVSKTGTETLTNKTLTSPVVNVGSDASGDMYYRNAGVLTRIPVGTDNQIMKLNGTTPNWEAETVTVAATESVEGISRLATAAQITAGTASEASYPLVVTPDQLALATPVFNGSGLTDISKLVSASDNLKFSADTERTDNTSAYVLKKSIVINHPGVVRVKYDIKTGSGNAYANIKTGGLSEATALLLYTGDTNSTSYVTKSVDLYVNAGTKLDLWLRGAPVEVAYVRNFRVYYDIGTFSSGTAITD